MSKKKTPLTKLPNPPIEVRASSAVRCFECGQSAVPAKHPAGMNASMPGRIGDAFHALAAELVHLDASQTDVESMILEHSSSHAADAEEVRFLTHWSLDHWNQIKHDYPDPITEIELRADLPGGKFRITGHPDVTSLLHEKRQANVLDYKTGRDPGDYLNQLMAYAYLIIKNDPNIDTVQVTQLDVRTSKIERHTYIRARIEEWAQYYADRLADEQYRIGNHCGLCPRRGECPRVYEWLSQMMRAFQNDPQVQLPDEMQEWGPPLKKAYDHAGQIEYALKDFNSGLKATLKQTGPLPLANGQSFGLVEKPRETIDAGKAYKIVNAKLGLTAEQMLQGMNLTKKSIGETCRSLATGDDDKARNKNAKRNELSLLGELRAAGAVSENSSEYVEVI